MSAKKKIAELRQKRGQILDQLGQITEKAENDNRDLTEAEAKDFAALEVEAKGLAERIQRQVKLAHELHDSAAEIANLPEPGAAGNVIKFPRYMRLKAFADTVEGRTAAYTVGRFALAYIAGHAPSLAWCNENGVVKAQAEGTDSAGGVLVPEQMADRIIDLREEFGVARRLADVIPMSRDTMIIPRVKSGLTSYFIGEGVAPTESQMGFNSVRLTAHKLGALAIFSNELSEDAIVSIGDMITRALAYEFAYKEDQCLFNGDGTSTYGGMVGVLRAIVDGTHAGSCVDATSGHDTFAEVDATDLTNVMGRLPLYAARNARWYVSQPGWALIFQRLMAAAGGNTTITLAGRVQFSYLGYPIEISQAMPLGGTINGTPMLLFGDMMSALAMGVRRDITIARSTEYRFAQDQTAILGTERFDINAHSLGGAQTSPQVPSFQDGPGPLIALNGKT